MVSARGSVATVLIGVIMVFFIGSVLLGELESTMDDMQVTGMSTDFNDTIDNLQSYAWTGFGLAVLAILVIAGAYILRQTQLL